MRRRQRRAIRLVAGSTVVASAAAAWLAASPVTLQPLLLPLIVLALTVGELVEFSLPVAFGRHWRLCGSEVALAAALTQISGLPLWMAAATAALLVLLAASRSGRSTRSAEYAGATFLAAVATGALGYGWCTAVGLPSVWSAAAGVVLGAAARHVLAAIAVGLTARRPLLPLVRRHLFTALGQAGGNAAIGLLVVELAIHQPLGLVGLLVPTVLVVSSYEQQLRSTAQARLYSELAGAQERAGARSVDSSAAVVLTVAARMLGGADVELLLNGSEGLIRYIGDEAGLQRRNRVDASALDAAWVQRLLASSGVRLTREHGRPECGVRIGSANPVRAVLSARRPPGAPAFTRREAMLVRALARQAEPWLSGSTASVGPALVDNGELTVVRDAARRVLGKANVDLVDPEELLEELHGLEHAVAVLVGSGGELSTGAAASDELGEAVPTPGAIAVDEPAAGEPSSDASPVSAPATAGQPFPAPRRILEWTTTGRLA